jgi:hypothetical protein
MEWAGIIQDNCTYKRTHNTFQEKKALAFLCWGRGPGPYAPGEEGYMAAMSGLPYLMIKESRINTHYSHCLSLSILSVLSVYW